MTLANRIATAISTTKDEDGFLFADMLSAEDIRIIAHIAAGVAEEHMREMGSE
jgi:hypothetical protein